MSDNTYISVFSIVQFPPEEKDINGKDCLKFTVRPSGGKGTPNFSCTLWPEHADLFASIDVGSVLALQGKYTVNKSNDKTFHNLSVSGIDILGKLSTGTRPETTEDDESDGDEAW